MKKFNQGLVIILTSIFMACPTIASPRNFAGMYYCQDSASVSITNSTGEVNSKIRFKVKVKQEDGYIEVIDHKNFDGTFKITNVTEHLVYSTNLGDSDWFTLQHGIKVSDNSDAYSFEVSTKYISTTTGVSHWNIAKGTCEKW